MTDREEDDQRGSSPKTNKRSQKFYPVRKDKVRSALASAPNAAYADILQIGKTDANSPREEHRDAPTPGPSDGRRREKDADEISIEVSDNIEGDATSERSPSPMDQGDEATASTPTPAEEEITEGRVPEPYRNDPAITPQIEEDIRSKYDPLHWRRLREAGAKSIERRRLRLVNRRK